MTAFSRRPIPTAILIATRMTATSISTMCQITTKQIISPEDFEAAAALIEQRASEKGIKKEMLYQQLVPFPAGLFVAANAGIP